MTGNIAVLGKKKTFALCVCVEGAWRQGLDRRLCVQEIKLPNAHNIARVKDGWGYENC